ncbi:hemolysin activation/secretion protein [filamentous cyanobacterium CCP3]|nr:hemolysin activation/secretion protein [filamentous cyanobacterium CCP3]
MPEPERTGDRLCITGFAVVGSTVFSEATLAEVARAGLPADTENCDLSLSPAETPAPGQLLTFGQLQQARDAVTQYYIDAGYITSGAYLPPQDLVTGLVTLRVVEGTVEEIEVSGLDRLNPSYVRDRISRSAQTPLNTERLLQGLQILQLDPLIETIQTELTAGTYPGTNRLLVTVSEASPYRLALVLDNARTPLVGRVQRRVRAGHLNLLGQGDRFFVDYANTDGSNSVNLSYTYPINAANGTLSVSHGRTRSWVIEEPFDFLNIRSSSRYTELTYRQPVYQTPTQELALSVTAARAESESRFNPGGFGELPFPVRGADAQGRTRITVLRFSQEWLSRDSQQVLALRSQFNLGIDALGTTVNPVPPDGRFFSWRGQGQWVWLMAPDTLLQLRGDIQLADRPLLPLEQIGIGGVGTVRGYRQDAILTDSGVTASAEVRIPIARVPEVDGLLQLVPFLDFGLGWNADGRSPNPNTLLSAGLGISWQMYNSFSARLDYGLPIVNAGTNGSTLQEEGLSFSFSYEPF